MPHSAVVVFTSKSVGTLLADGGSSCWVLDADRAAECEYVICTRNANSRVGEIEDAHHRTAFLIGRVSGVAGCEREPIPGRKILEGAIVQFDRYARINVPNVWPYGRRNPVTYTADAESLLGRRPDSLVWRPV